MIKIALFSIVSAGLIYVSRRSLRTPRSHGFYRFFAWEFMLALCLLNLDAWFLDPWSWNQLIAWTLLSVCIVPLFFGIRGLVRQGKPAPLRTGEPELLAFEQTSTLVTSGIYQYIRHPLYSSLLLLNWGIFFKAPGTLGAALAAVASLFLFATARADEDECVRFFGPAYQEYMKRTRMFLPFLF